MVSAEQTEQTSQTDLQALSRLMELGDYILPFALRVTADLGVADQLAGGPLPVERIAEVVGAHPGALQRVLRALASKDIFTEPRPGVFGLTPMAGLLRTDHPMSVRASYTLLDADVQAWAKFDHSVRTGQNAFELVHGCQYWEYTEAHPDFRVRFDASMRGFTAMELRAILPCYEWNQFGLVADLGGGTGGLLSGLLAQFPDMRGVLMDLPSVVDRAAPVLAKAGVAERCEIVPGSFFDSVPKGADAYILKRVLYSWDDEACVRVLSLVRAAMAAGGKVILLDPIVRHGPESGMTKIQDLLVLAVDRGHTRTRKQLAALVQQAGFRLARMIPTYVFPITVLEPAES
jgi:hypothetical protein